MKGKVDVITVVGARPQFVKAAVVSRSFKKSDRCRERILHTGQHYDPAMSDNFFSSLGIPSPVWNLEVGSGTHGLQTGRMLIKIEEILLKERPNIVLVYGDTNSTLAAALAASKLNIPVAHVEAGIRSNNFSVPEELNRRMTDHISTLLFPPTRAGVEHLLREGIPEAKIHLVGDVMYDLSIVSGQIAALESKVLDQLRVSKRSFVLATIHRAENTDSPLRIQSILKLLELIAKEIPVVLPVHPRSRPIINSYFASKPSNNGLILTDPVGYFDMVQLEQNALAIVTDSGGVQKEAYFHKVPCVTTKDDTEWPETVSAGCNFLASPGNAEAMFEIFKNALKSKCNWGQSFYGNGDAGVKIVSRIEQMSDWSSSQVSQ